jgi:tRNA(adenine34) deaminase
MFTEQDSYWMQQAIALAENAARNAEVPVGAVLIHENKIIGQGSNSPISHSDPSAHAEILALREGAKTLNNYRLINSTLYVTLEPCVMCLGAIVHARVKRVVFGAFDLKTGAVESVFDLGKTNKFNHTVEYQGGLLAQQCGGLLSQFFRARRAGFKED